MNKEFDLDIVGKLKFYDTSYIFLRMSWYLFYVPNGTSLVTIFAQCEKKFTPIPDRALQRLLYKTLKYSHRQTNDADLS